MPVCGGRRLGSGNRLVQSGPWSPFGKILNRRGVDDYDVKRKGKYVAHLRHDRSYSPGPEITWSSPGSSSRERLMRHTEANSSPGSHSKNN
jgi:hypothetical protein